MRVQILSDLHLECDPDHGAAFMASVDPGGVDVLVVAGDVHPVLGLSDALRRVCRRYDQAQVVYTPGNHEYYGATPEHVGRVLSEIQRDIPNLHVLDGGTEEVGGVKFAGATLWFRDDLMNSRYRGLIADFRHIYGLEPWVYTENKKAEAFLRRQLASDRPPDVVVTHHLPSWECVVPRYRGQQINRFFVAPVADDLVQEGIRLPPVWVCGHTHAVIDQMQHGCRFVCHPRGYPSERRDNFKGGLMLDVGSR